MGVLTICRVFGLGIGGAFGGIIPFGGLIVLGVVVALALRAYRNLAVLRIAMPLAILFHGYMIMANTGADIPWMSVAMFGLMIILAALSMPIYRADAVDRFSFSDLWDEFFAGLMPPTILISFALGSILLGLATPAEAAAMGAISGFIA